MATVISDRVYTPDDLLKVADSTRFELVDGRLEETSMGALACWIASMISCQLTTFVLQRRLGIVISSEGQYQCFPQSRGRIRKPDVSFIDRSKVTDEILRGFIQVAPDLVVEVISENDLYYEVESKVREYLGAGVRLIWVVNPSTSSVRVFRPNQSSRDVDSRGQLDGEEVLPGFAMAVAPLFEPPPMANN